MDALGLGTLLITLLTEAAQALAKKLGNALPGGVKQVIALLVSAGVVSLSTLHLPQIPALGAQGNAALDTLILWFAGMLFHDIAVAPAEAKK